MSLGTYTSSATPPSERTRLREYGWLSETTESLTGGLVAGNWASVPASSSTLNSTFEGQFPNWKIPSFDACCDSSLSVIMPRRHHPRIADMLTGEWPLFAPPSLPYTIFVTSTFLDRREIEVPFFINSRMREPEGLRSGPLGVVVVANIAVVTVVPVPGREKRRPELDGFGILCVRHGRKTRSVHASCS